MCRMSGNGNPHKDPLFVGIIQSRKRGYQLVRNLSNYSKSPINIRVLAANRGKILWCTNLVDQEIHFLSGEFSARRAFADARGFL